ncbi:MAG: glycosyltransferase family 2 protein [Planctomycetota bacterium]
MPGKTQGVSLVSIVVPFLNEERSLGALWNELEAALADREERFEFVFVDDGSTDGSAAYVGELQKRDARVSRIRFSRNFGHQAALTASLRAARGRAVVSLDADLQHPPSLIPRMLDRWHEGAEVVQALREDPGKGFSWKSLLSRGFYRVFRALSGVDLPAGMADFRLLDRQVLDGLLSFQEPPFWRGMVLWAGFRREVLFYTPPARRFGEPKYTLRKSLGLALEALFAYSRTPIYLLWILACLAGLVGLFGIADALGAFLRHKAVPGWTSLMMTSGLIGGAVLASLAAIATYVERIHRMVSSRPLYLLRRPDEGPEDSQALPSEGEGTARKR